MALVLPSPTTAQSLPSSDASDRLIAQWLHGRPAHTQRAYRREAARLRAFLGPDVGLDRVTLAVLQGYADHLAEQPLTPASRARALAAVKALLAFGHRLGVLPVNAGAVLRLPPVRRGLSGRILPEADVHKLLTLTTSPRDHALLRLLYASGLRVGELYALRWRDLVPYQDSAVVTVWGKGAKERTVLLPAGVWAELQALRGAAEDGAPLFRSRSGTPHGRATAAGLTGLFEARQGYDVRGEELMDDVYYGELVRDFDVNDPSDGILLGRVEEVRYKDGSVRFYAVSAVSRTHCSASSEVNAIQALKELRTNRESRD